MTSTEKRQEAERMVEMFKNSNKLTKESISLELEKTNRIIRKELSYSKHLRNLDYLSGYLLLRPYYKQILKLL